MSKELVNRLRQCLRYDTPTLGESELEQAAREAANALEALWVVLESAERDLLRIATGSHTKSHQLTASEAADCIHRILHPEG